MSTKSNNEGTYECPLCGKKQTLGNSYVTKIGYICLDCIKKGNQKLKIIPEEKKVLCPFCKKELTANNLVFTPTILLCSSCEEEFSKIFPEPDPTNFLPEKNRTKRRQSDIKVTVGFISLIIAVYIISSFPTFQRINELFLHWGALVPFEVINQHQYWRLITANLLHLDLLHIGANSISILIWGHLLERLIGSKALLALIIISSFTTTLLSCYFSSASVSLGASGIAYALMFALVIYIVYITALKKPEEFKGQVISILVLMAFQIFYNIQESSVVNIWGHLGGAIGGIFFIIGYISFITLLKANNNLN